MRLAIIHHDLSVRGGAERMVCEVGDRLEQRGHEVVYVASRFNPELSYPKLRHKKVVKTDLPLSLPGGYMRAYCEAFNTFGALLKVLGRTAFDALLFSKHYSLLHVAKKLRDIPSAMYVHYPETLLAEAKTPLRRLYRKPIDRMEAASFSDADAVLSNSVFTAKTIFTLFRREAVPAYAGVDIDFFKPPSREDTDESLILSVNRFAEYKNLELAIEAASYVLKELPKAHLILAGNLERESYSYYAKLERTIEDKGIGHSVKMMTNLSDTGVLRLYQKCALFLYPPLREHFGLGPIEAMACGKPVIVSESGGPRETVVHGSTGFRLANDPRLWAEHVIELLEDPQLRARMGKASRQHVERNFTWERVTDTIESALKDMTER